MLVTESALVGGPASFFFFFKIHLECIFSSQTDSSKSQVIEKFQSEKECSTLGDITFSENRDNSVVCEPVTD